jgi:hypothetical protein
VDEDAFEFLQGQERGFPCLDFGIRQSPGWIVDQEPLEVEKMKELPDRPNALFFDMG